jgi:hypothetical protein
MGCNCKRGNASSSRSIVKRTAPRDSVRTSRTNGGGKIVRRIIK